LEGPKSSITKVWDIYKKGSKPGQSDKRLLVASVLFPFLFFFFEKKRSFVTKKT